MEIPGALSERRPETSQIDDDLGLAVDDQRVSAGGRDQVEAVVDQRLHFGLNSGALIGVLGNSEFTRRNTGKHRDQTTALSDGP